MNHYPVHLNGFGSNGDLIIGVMPFWSLYASVYNGGSDVYSLPHEYEHLIYPNTAEYKKICFLGNSELAWEYKYVCVSTEGDPKLSGSVHAPANVDRR